MCIRDRYDDSYDSSVYAVQSAREALAIEQESVEAAFASMFQSVQDLSLIHI